MDNEFFKGTYLLRKRTLAIDDSLNVFGETKLNPIFQRYKGEDYAYIKYPGTSENPVYVVYLNEDCNQVPTVINNLGDDKGEVHHICYACQVHYIDNISLRELNAVTGYTNFPFYFLVSPSNNINIPCLDTIRRRAEKAISESKSLE